MSSLIACKTSVFSEKLITDFKPAKMKPNEGLLLILTSDGLIGTNFT